MGPASRPARGQPWVLAAAPQHGQPCPSRSSCRGPISVSVALGSPPSGESRGCSGEKRESGARRDLQGCRRLNSACSKRGVRARDGSGASESPRAAALRARCNRRVRARFTSSSLTTELRGQELCCGRARLPLPQPSVHSTSPEPLLSAQGLKLSPRLWEKGDGAGLNGRCGFPAGDCSPLLADGGAGPRSSACRIMEQLFPGRHPRLGGELPAGNSASPRPPGLGWQPGGRAFGSDGFFLPLERVVAWAAGSAACGTPALCDPGECVTLVSRPPPAPQDALLQPGFRGESGAGETRGELSRAGLCCGAGRKRRRRKRGGLGAGRERQEKVCEFGSTTS